MQKPTPDSTDYGIYFSPCKEFEAFYYHLSTVSDKIKSAIKPPYKYCNSEQLGRFEVTSECEKEVRIKLSAGELLGTVGKLSWQYSFDMGAYDLRTEPLDYANPSRWQKWQQHIVCPLDYFSIEIKNRLKAKLGEGVLRTVEPICGEIEQDVPGTAQGVWFVRGAKSYARPELSLIHDFIDPSIGAFAFGLATEKSGLVPNVLHFNPKNSGLVNRDFKDITSDGNVYCYDNLVKQWSYERKPESFIVLVQLTTSTTLRIEGKAMTACGSGPWQMSNYTELER